MCSAKITSELCDATTIIVNQVVSTTDDVRSRSMRASTVMALLMALLMARVDTDTIRLVGKGRSNSILCYFHTKAQTFTEGLTVRMVQHGDYALILPSQGG